MSDKTGTLFSNSSGSNMLQERHSQERQKLATLFASQFYFVQTASNRCISSYLKIFYLGNGNMNEHGEWQYPAQSRHCSHPVQSSSLQRPARPTGSHTAVKRERCKLGKRTTGSLFMPAHHRTPKGRCTCNPQIWKNIGVIWVILSPTQSIQQNLGHN